MENNDLISLYHTKGCRPCNGLAFWYSAPHYSEGSILVAPHAENIDGSIPVVGEKPRCGTCGVVISNRMGQDVSPSRPATRPQE